jgi:hypothetical protein
MDPFLENPDIFPDFHERFITYVSDSIQERLPPPYIAAIGRRAWIEVSERFIGPDVQVVRPPVTPTDTGGRFGSGCRVATEDGAAGGACSSR